MSINQWWNLHIHTVPVHWYWYAAIIYDTSSMSVSYSNLDQPDHQLQKKELYGYICKEKEQKASLFKVRVLLIGFHCIALFII